MIKALIESSEERIRHPVFGVFVGSWVAFNWKPIAILLFSGKTIEQKIELISADFSDVHSILWRPAAATVIYVVILPFLMAAISVILQASEWIKDQTLIVKESRDYSNQNKIFEAKFEAEQAKSKFLAEKGKNTEVEALRSRIQQLESQIENMENFHSSELQSNSAIIAKLQESSNEYLRGKAESDTIISKMSSLAEKEGFIFRSKGGTDVTLSKKI